MSITFRPGSMVDVDKAMPIIIAFHREELHKFGFFGDVEKLAEMARLNSENSFVAETDDGRIVGLIAGMIVTSSSDNKPIFHEVMWYVLPAYRNIGLKLYQKMEDACRDKGITRMLMIHMCNDFGDRVSKLYEGMGYKAIETHYMKDLR